LAASTAANAVGQKKVNKERSKTLQQSIVDRSKLQQDSESKAADTANQLAGIAEKSKALAAQRDAAAAPAATGPPQPQGDATKTLLDLLGPTANQTIVQDAQKQGGARDATYGQMSRARMNLDDFGNLMVAANKGVMRNAQDVGHNINSAQNWEQNVLPLKLDAANAAGRDWNTLGDVLQLAASIYAPTALGGGQAASQAATKAALLKGSQAGIAAPTWAFAGY
jgi:hypothetical protein